MYYVKLYYFKEQKMLVCLLVIIYMFKVEHKPRLYSFKVFLDHKVTI